MHSQGRRRISHYQRGQDQRHNEGGHHGLAVDPAPVHEHEGDADGCADPGAASEGQEQGGGDHEDGIPGQDTRCQRSGVQQLPDCERQEQGEQGAQVVRVGLHPVGSNESMLAGRCCSEKAICRLQHGNYGQHVAPHQEAPDQHPGLARVPQQLHGQPERSRVGEDGEQPFVARICPEKGDVLVHRKGSRRHSREQKRQQR